jgi:hypothetical protein
MAEQNSTSMEQGGRSTNLLSDVVLLAWWRSWGRSLRSPVVGVRRPRRHLVVGGDPLRRPSVLRQPLVVGAVPPRRSSVPR